MEDEDEKELVDSVAKVHDEFAQGIDRATRAQDRGAEDNSACQASPVHCCSESCCHV